MQKNFNSPTTRRRTQRYFGFDGIIIIHYTNLSEMRVHIIIFTLLLRDVLSSRSIQHLYLVLKNPYTYIGPR